MKLERMARLLLLCGLVLGSWAPAGRAAGLEVQFNQEPAGDGLVLADDKTVVGLLVETNCEPAVLRAAGDLAEDFSQVTGRKPVVTNDYSSAKTGCIIIGTIGRSKIIDELVAAKNWKSPESAGNGKAIFCRWSKIHCREFSGRWSLRAVTGGGRFTASMNYPGASGFAVELVGGCAGAKAEPYFRERGRFAQGRRR